MATRFVKGSYQEIIDLHTESDHVTALGIHTPTGSTPRQMFKGFFDQYKKYKYLGCSIKLVPAARLPADPLAVSYDAGEPTIDPRDMLNPLMFHGCHGNDLGMILNRLYGDNNEISDSIDGLDTFGTAGGDWIQNPNAVIFNEVMERLYYKALTDNTWKKAHPQRGFMKKGLHPLVYSMATNRQLMPGSLIDTSDVGDYGDMSILGADPTTEYSGTDPVRSLISRNGVQFFTPKLTSLGWIDTRNELTSAQNIVPVEDDEENIDLASTINNLAVSQINHAELPKIYMGVILLPPAYKTEQYYRMVVNHRFAFKGFRGISFMPEVGNVPSYYNANSDLFSPDQYGGESGNSDTTTGGDAGSGGSGDSGSGGGSTSGSIVLMHQVTKQSGINFDRFASEPVNTIPIFRQIVLEDNTTLNAGYFTTSTSYLKNFEIIGFGVIDNTIRLIAGKGDYDSSENQYTGLATCYLTSNGWINYSNGNSYSTAQWPGGWTSVPTMTTEQYNRFKAGIDATGATLDTSSWS